MTEKRFSWEYSHYDSTGEIYDWKRKECLITDYLQKYEIEEWCQELNKIVDENEQLKKENTELKENVSKLINDAILEILDGQRYEGERILNNTLELLK